jgi:hypothetical protein
LRQAISKKEKYERKIKDIVDKDNTSENVAAEKNENAVMAENPSIDYET